MILGESPEEAGVLLVGDFALLGEKLNELDVNAGIRGFIVAPELLAGS